MAGEGIEPPPEAYETSVLPLHSPTIKKRGKMPLIFIRNGKWSGLHHPS
jgi:hypothetical protein